MKDRFAITIHLTNASREKVREAAARYGMPLKTFIETVLPYISNQIIDSQKLSNNGTKND